jgi:hypothetical protein
VREGNRVERFDGENGRQSSVVQIRLRANYDKPQCLYGIRQYPKKRITPSPPYSLNVENRPLFTDQILRSRAPRRVPRVSSQPEAVEVFHRGVSEIFSRLNCSGPLRAVAFLIDPSISFGNQLPLAGFPFVKRIGIVPSTVPQPDGPAQP